MTDLGAPHVMNPILGETHVELHEYQQKVWDPDQKEDVVNDRIRLVDFLCPFSQTGESDFPFMNSPCPAPIQGRDVLVPNLIEFFVHFC